MGDSNSASPPPRKPGPEAAPEATPGPAAKPKKLRPGMNSDKVAFLNRIKAINEAEKSRREKD